MCWGRACENWVKLLVSTLLLYYFTKLYTVDPPGLDHLASINDQFSKILRVFESSLHLEPPVSDRKHV